MTPTTQQPPGLDPARLAPWFRRTVAGAGGDLTYEVTDGALDHPLLEAGLTSLKEYR
ncbi:hypothetical protein [Streptomyces sp. MUM 178J]|uniref:hypothetical protein n=1 Tax=Streptomyces sp. MUM 178J TaxID=2791991 RepID=UPI001F03863C|nr:hypothetical protein [Streptomyces sp. MUM 178J]WRQ77979.1 hypothetical protein I3F59_000480 [Streptomyces sp. MUM 178J]